MLLQLVMWVNSVKLGKRTWLSGVKTARMVNPNSLVASELCSVSILHIFSVQCFKALELGRKWFIFYLIRWNRWTITSKGLDFELSKRNLWNIHSVKHRDFFSMWHIPVFFLGIIGFCCEFIFLTVIFWTKVLSIITW